MIKALNMIIVYGFTFGVWGLLLYFPIKLDVLKCSKWLISGLTVMLASILFNIVYTGLLGWNYLPGSQLESLLDTVSFIVWFIGFILYYVGLSKVNK